MDVVHECHACPSTGSLDCQDTFFVDVKCCGSASVKQVGANPFQIVAVAQKAKGFNGLFDCLYHVFAAHFATTEVM